MIQFDAVGIAQAQEMAHRKYLASMLPTLEDKWLAVAAADALVRLMKHLPDIVASDDFDFMTELAVEWDKRRRKAGHHDRRGD